MRHGKAEPFAADDYERVLTDRGLRSAEDAGRHLSETGNVPDFAVVSSSARTQQTWAAVDAASQSGAQLSVDDTVYSGSPDVVLEALRAVPADSRVVIFVGHNPSAATLANQLDDGNGDPAAISGMLQGFPAGALVILEVELLWSELGTETGRVIDFYVGTG